MPFMNSSFDKKKTDLDVPFVAQSREKVADLSRKVVVDLEGGVIKLAFKGEISHVRAIKINLSG
jgi:hypothetical protein